MTLPVKMTTLGDALASTAARLPDRPALLSEERELTWSALDREVNRLAHLLLSMGVGKGDAIGFLIHKRPEVVTGFLAAARIGAVMVPVNFKLAPEALRSLFESAAIRAIFLEAAHEPLLAHLGELRPPPARILAVAGPLAGGGVAYEASAGHPETPPELDVSPEDPCYYNYTSGTTGRPKGAVTTHHNVLANAVSTIEGLGFGEDDVFLGMFSVFSHPHELFHRSILTGGAFAIVDSFSPRVILEAVARWRVRWMMAVPSFYEMMLDHGDARAREGLESPDTSCLRVLEAGGAYVGAETMARMEERFPGATFVPVWGSTEATGVAIANGPGLRRPGATGRIMPGYHFRVVDEDGAPVAPGEIGELTLSGASLARGYIRNPEESAALFVDGWYHTRDLVRVDEEGWIYFTGRRSEMLKIGGLRVYPLEIEEAIRKHPEVRDVVVVGANDRVRGEMARAIVTTTPGSALDVRGVRHWCRASLATYKVPRVVEFWAELPRLPNGKVDKRAVIAREPEPGRDERGA